MNKQPWNYNTHNNSANIAHNIVNGGISLGEFWILWLVANAVIGIISFVLGILQVLFIILLCSLPLCLLIYIGYVLYAKFESKKVVAIGVIITLFCYFGIIHYVVPKILAPTPISTTRRIDNSVHDMWANIIITRSDDSSSSFVNGKSNRSYQQQHKLMMVQAQPSLSDEGSSPAKYPNANHMNVKHSGNRAVVHYQVTYDFNNHNKNYAWVAHLQKIHSKWLVTTDTSNNQVVSSS